MRRALAALMFTACGSSPSPSATTTTSSTPATPPVISGDAPEISRTVGADGGIVVLWPRVGRNDDPSSRQVAAQMQERLAAIARKTGRAVDVRPEPERVCPRGGCNTFVIGSALLRHGDACAAIATISGRGETDATIVIWAGDMTLKSPVSAFREPPESQVQIRDYGSCATLATDLAARDKEVEAALAIATGN